MSLTGSRRVTTTPGTVAGLLLGGVLGRTHWSSVATDVPAVAAPIVPLAATALIALGTIAVGLVLAIAPAYLTTRIRPADVLERD